MLSFFTALFHFLSYSHSSSASSVLALKVKSCAASALEEEEEEEEEGAVRGFPGTPRREVDSSSRFRSKCLPRGAVNDSRWSFSASFFARSWSIVRVGASSSIFSSRLVGGSLFDPPR